MSCKLPAAHRHRPSADSASDVHSVHSLCRAPDRAPAPPLSPAACTDPGELSSASPASSHGPELPPWSIWDVTPVVRAVDSLFDTHSARARARARARAPAHTRRSRRKDGRPRTSMNDANVIYTADLIDPLQLLSILNLNRCPSVPNPLL